MKQTLLKFTLLALLALAFICAAVMPCGTAYAGATDVTFAWDPVTDPQVTEVRLFQRDFPGGTYDYTNWILAVPATDTEATAYAILNGTYAWVARAVDNQGRESDDSNEVTDTLDAPPGVIENLRIPLKVP